MCNHGAEKFYNWVRRQGHRFARDFLDIETAEMTISALVWMAHVKNKKHRTWEYLIFSW